MDQKISNNTKRILREAYNGQIPARCTVNTMKKWFTDNTDEQTIVVNKTNLDYLTNWMWESYNDDYKEEKRK